MVKVFTFLIALLVTAAVAADRSFSFFTADNMPLYTMQCSELQAPARTSCTLFTPELEFLYTVIEMSDGKVFYVDAPGDTLYSSSFASSNGALLITDLYNPEYGALSGSFGASGDVFTFQNTAKTVSTAIRLTKNPVGSPTRVEYRYAAGEVLYYATSDPGNATARELSRAETDRELRSKQLQGDMRLIFTSRQTGVARVETFRPDGRRVAAHSMPCRSGVNTLPLNRNAAGLLVARVRFDNQEVLAPILPFGR